MFLIHFDLHFSVGIFLCVQQIQELRVSALKKDLLVAVEKSFLFFCVVSRGALNASSVSKSDFSYRVDGMLAMQCWRANVKNLQMDVSDNVKAFQVVSSFRLLNK